MEINPKHDSNHMCIFEMKCEKALGFDHDEHDGFFILDQKKNVYKMNRMKQHRLLIESNTYHIKDKDLQSF